MIHRVVQKVEKVHFYVGADPNKAQDDMSIVTTLDQELQNEAHPTRVLRTTQNRQRQRLFPLSRSCQSPRQSAKCGAYREWARSIMVRAPFTVLQFTPRAQRVTARYSHPDLPQGVRDDGDELSVAYGGPRTMHWLPRSVAAC